MSKEAAPNNTKMLPVTRLAMLAACCVITLAGVINGLDPFVIFYRMMVGTGIVGGSVFLIHLWFSTLFT